MSKLKIHSIFLLMAQVVRPILEQVGRGEVVHGPYNYSYYGAAAPLQPVLYGFEEVLPMMKQTFGGRGAAADDAKIFSSEDWGAGYSA